MIKKIIQLSFYGIIATVLLVSTLLLLIIQPGGSGVVASLQLPDGSKYMVTQRCNWSLEPYTVSFYMRSKNGQWGWCYIDHQATRWRNVQLIYDSNRDVIDVTEDGTWKAALNRKQGTFAIGNSKPKRELKAPQSVVIKPEFTYNGRVTSNSIIL